MGNQIILINQINNKAKITMNMNTKIKKYPCADTIHSHSLHVFYVSICSIYSCFQFSLYRVLLLYLFVHL